jgi:hypothetical protein
MACSGTAFFYNTFIKLRWSGVVNENSVDFAVNFNASVSEAINKGIPSAKPKHSTFLHRFPKYLIYYIKEKKHSLKK